MDVGIKETFFYFKTNENQSATELLMSIREDNFRTKYAQYCCRNCIQNNDTSQYQTDPYHQKLSSPSQDNACGMYQEDFSYFLFPIKFPIIRNKERKARLKELVVSCTMFSIDTLKYCEELRSLEIFQVLWNQILLVNTDFPTRALLFIDLHVFSHFYASITYKAINERKPCSIGELVAEKFKFDDLTALDFSGGLSGMCLCSDGEYGATLTSSLIQKLRDGIQGAAESELVYDLKRKISHGSHRNGVLLNSIVVTLLECHFLKKSYSKGELLTAYLNSGRNTLAKTISELKLVISTTDGKIKNMYSGQQGDEVLVVRTLKKMSSMTSWLYKNEVYLADIKPGGKFSSDVVVEGFSCGLIDNTGHRVLYLKPSEDFQIIPHYTNYNNHVELGMVSQPLVEMRTHCRELHKAACGNTQKLLSYLIYTGIKVEDFDVLDKLNV